ncbi:MAG TPA: GAF domain-containing sensor histidine kinase [Rickettsiales bacterium]|nr:GAF domain-containing sensor histidine kinase [Rickettsiales bacterium]
MTKIADEKQENVVSLADAAPAILALKKQIVEQQNPAFLCTAIRKENPNYLAIIHANKTFGDVFDSDLEYVIGKSYDFLFDNIDVNYSSDDQLEYIRLTKDVKNREECSIILKLDSYVQNKYQVSKFKINFKPIIDTKLDKFYAIFIFERINEKVEYENDEKPQNQILIKNLERALNNEKLLRQISYLVIADKPVKEISQNIAESLCKNLKIDRCLIHDRRNKKSNFIVEYCAENTKKIIDEKNKKEGLKEANRYIDFQNSFYEKFKNNDKKEKNNAIFVINDIKNDQNFAALKDFYEKYAINSQIIAITSFDNAVNGGIYVHLSDQRTLTIDEIELIEIIADQLAIAIDRSYSIEKVMVANHNLLRKTLELKEAVKKEKEMRKMQTEFVALVSHEFKTPLQIIDSTRELMSRKLKTLDLKDDSFSKYLERIKNGIQRVTGLINSTLNLAKLETNDSEIKIDKQPFDLHTLLEDIIEKTANSTIEKKIKIKTNFCEEGGNINADEKLLDHCFTNIISNAIKYSKPNTEVEVITKCNKEKIAIRIVDKGIGIPKEDIPNIGKKFFRAKNTLSVSGTGIGIYLTKYFIELHNGKIIIDSEINVGTTFTTILPR